MNFAPREAEQFWHQCALVTILVIAACTRFYNLDQFSLSPDALQYLSYCQIDDWWEMVISNQSHSGMPPLYPTLLCQITHWTHDSEFFVRALSALAGLATIYFIYITGRDFISPTAGLLAAAIVATEFQALTLNRDASVYSLLSLFCLVHNYCFCQLFFSTNCYTKQPLTISHHGKRSNVQFSWQPGFPADTCCLLGFWISGALAFYTSPMALIQLFSEALASGFLIKKFADIFPDWRTAMRSLWLPLFIAILPWLPILYGYRLWILEGHLFALQSPAVIWQHIENVLPINPILLNLAIALSVLFVLFIIAFRLIKKKFPPTFPLIVYITFQFSIATLSLWLLLPASPLSYFYYWWIFILLMLFPISIGIDMISSSLHKKWMIAIAVTLILVLQIKSNAHYRLYDTERGGDFRLAAKIIHDDVEFMKTRREIVMSTHLFQHYLEQNDIKLSNFTIIDAKAKPDIDDTFTNHSAFYYLEFAPYNKELEEEPLAFQTLSSQHKKVCMTKLPWIRVVKFSRDPSISTDVTSDCRAHLSGVVTLP